MSMVVGKRSVVASEGDQDEWTADKGHPGGGPVDEREPTRSVRTQRTIKSKTLSAAKATARTGGDGREPTPQGRNKLSRSRPMSRRWKVAMGATALIVMAVSFAATLVYVRLLNGPISLQWLVADIERAISEEMGGRPARIDSAALRLADAGGFEIDLANIVIRERDGITIDQASGGRRGRCNPGPGAERAHRAEYASVLAWTSRD
jgi:hypothetical protein